MASAGPTVPEISGKELLGILVERIGAVFDAFDADGNGSIELAESAIFFGMFLRDETKRGTSEPMMPPFEAALKVAAAAIDMADEDRNASLSRDEFIGTMIRFAALNVPVSLPADDAQRRVILFEVMGDALQALEEEAKKADIASPTAGGAAGASEAAGEHPTAATGSDPAAEFAASGTLDDPKTSKEGAVKDPSEVSVKDAPPSHQLSPSDGPSLRATSSAASVLLLRECSTGSTSGCIYPDDALIDRTYVNVRKRTFAKLDKDSNGWLDVTELDRLVRLCLVPVLYKRGTAPEEATTEWFKVLDSDEDARISAAEFVDGVESLRRHFRLTELQMLGLLHGVFLPMI